jgi:UDP-glucose:(heptosyl)LPS alpha-1,3-glucosyltransferase
MERVTFEIARRLHERGWDLTVIARSCTLLQGPRLRFHRLLAPGRPVSIALALSYLHGTMLVRRHRRGLLTTTMPVIGNRVDAIGAHFSEAAYRSKVGTSRSRRSDPLFRLNSWIAGLIELGSERWSYRPARARRIVCVSEGLAREIAAHYPAVTGLLTVIPNGVDSGAWAPDPVRRTTVRAELGIPAGAPVALFVGGDWHRKGLRHAIESVGRARDWHLIVVGEGDRASFSALSERLQAGDRIHFTGRLRDPRPQFAAADALVFPTSYEAFSLVTLEAAAAGLVLIAPRVSGTEELIDDGVNGWLTPAEADAISARLRELSADPDRLARMRSAARDSSEAYDWERVVDAYESLYEEMLGIRPPMRVSRGVKR